MRGIKRRVNARNKRSRVPAKERDTKIIFAL